MTAQVVGAVFARGRSKGIPRKNLQLVNGRSLVCYAVQVGLESEHVERVIVSTDDAEVAAEARRCGAEVPFARPAELARDDAPEWLAWRHAIEFLRAEAGHAPAVLVVLPPTAPLRSVTDVDACVEALLGSDADGVITVTRADRNPYFNMVTIDADGYARLVNPPASPVHRRQDVPEVWDMTTVAYAVRSEFVLRSNGLFSGRLRAVEVPRERALDIDTDFDLRVARLLMEGRKPAA